MKMHFPLLLSAALLLASCTATQNPANIVRDENQYRQAVEALRAGNFVLEGDQLLFRRGGMAMVDEGTNFISVTPALATVQTAFNNGRLGANNLGGITLEGRPDDPKITTDKRGNIDYEVDIDGFFSARITISLWSGSNRATATIFPTFSGNTMTMNGTLVPAEKASVFKGRTTP